jgi:hypothetical protein
MQPKRGHPVIVLWWLSLSLSLSLSKPRDGSKPTTQVLRTLDPPLKSPSPTPKSTHSTKRSKCCPLQIKPLKLAIEWFSICTFVLVKRVNCVVKRVISFYNTCSVEATWRATQLRRHTSTRAIAQFSAYHPPPHPPRVFWLERIERECRDLRDWEGWSSGVS